MTQTSNAAGVASGLALPAAATRFLPLLVICGTFAGMLVFSWGKWPDVLVDFGHEIYVPWQLSEGKVLGRDMQWVATGPLSPYFNAGLFAAFGVSLRTLVVANLSLLALLTWILFLLLRTLADRLSATVALVVFLTIFAFGQYVGIGNYNYVTPYSHGVTHGMLLSLATLWLLHCHVAGGRRTLLAAAGLCFGLVFLTKPEIFVAGAAATGPSLLVSLRKAGGMRAAVRLSLLFVGTFALPSVVALLALSQQLPIVAAARLAFVPWLIMFGSQAAGSRFYMEGSGLDMPAQNLTQLALWSGLYLSFIVPAALLDRYVPLRGSSRAIAAVIVFAATALCAQTWIPIDIWAQMSRPLPLAALCGSGAYLLLLFRRAGDERAQPRLLLGLSMSVFALLLLLKMLLNARVYHYGFALAMPATLLLVTWLTHSLPNFVRARGGSGIVFRAASIALLLACSVAFVRLSAVYYDRKVFPVGNGADTFLADARGQFVSHIMKDLESAKPGATLTVLPEGVMINYLARRVTPIPYLAFMSDSIAFFGSEEPLLAALRQSPPDLILLVHRDSSEHGARFFGRDYAILSSSWIAENYEGVSLAGAMPNQSNQYGMLLMTRRTADAPPATPPTTSGES